MLELYKAGVTAEDANLKFLRSLPSIWNMVATMIRGQPGLEKMDFDDLYNNLKLFESDVAPPSTPNVAFVSFERSSGTKYAYTASAPVNTNYIVTYPSSESSAAYQGQSGSSTSYQGGSYTDNIIHSFFASNSSVPELDQEDLEQVDPDDL